MEPGRDSCAHGSIRRARVDQEGRVSPCLRLSRLSRLRHGHTCCKHERKTDRVHSHGPHFPRQLVSHSPTHRITQDALLDMIDAIDTDMHARPGDAELILWLLVLDCAPQHSC